MENNKKLKNNEKWSYKYEKYKKINTMEELYKLIDLINKDNKNNLFFRGQANSDWKLDSSYNREEIKKNKKTNINILKKNNIYIFEKRIEYIKSKSDEKSTIEILSKMQHYNLKTLLVDFTSNFLNSLWFAFSKEFENKLKYKSIFLLKCEKNIAYEINNLEEEGLIYKCPISNNRGIKQKSYFILDNGAWDQEKYKKNIYKIYISNDLENKIIKFLKNKKIVASEIYPDLEGLMLEFETISSIYCFIKGLGFDNNEKIKKAIEYYDKAIELNSNDLNNINSYFNKGLLLLEKRKNYEDAIKCFDNVIKLIENYLNNYFKNNLDIFYNDKKINFNKKNKLNIENGEIFCKNYFESFFQKGIAWKNLKENKKAIKCFDKAIELNPNYFNAYSNKALILIESEPKKYDEIIKCLNKVIKLNNKKNFEPYLWKGIILEEIKKYDEAINCYDKAIELKPNNANIYYNKAISLAKLKKYPEAIKCINKAIKLKPNNTNYKSYKYDLLKKIKK